MYIATYSFDPSARTFVCWPLDHWMAGGFRLQMVKKAKIFRSGRTTATEGNIFQPEYGAVAFASSNLLIETMEKSIEFTVDFVSTTTPGTDAKAG